MTTARQDPSAPPPVQELGAPWRGLSVARATVTQGVAEWERPPSDGFRLVVHLRGTARCEADTGDGRRRTVSCAPGDVCRIPPGHPRVAVRCRLLGPGPLEMVRIVLPAEVFGRHTAEEPGGRPVDLQSLERLPAPDPLICTMAAALVRAREAGAGQLYADSAAEYLAAHLLAPLHGEAAPGALGRRELDTVIAYMRAHLADRVGLDDLARQVALSRFHFLRLFSATTGRTPHQFLTALRIETACRLLERGDEPVGRIGRWCGFSTASHFSTVFRRQVGHTPTEYRRLWRGPV
ncbi:AraC family transcriptional regulator [Streptomyces sp. NBC_00582]|uniref:AraC family transcriptional regulator n=1 Tax=Streptomyces sp. NBC_00582 TaxID=2975783 RepID=UPI002E81AD51|nr:AraC family transcriptional regulator [Streptomyces sp. NBC_00582]WUB66405.1 AraC family transcriptional regulator [Streptomyces sp. NBC_00582]